MSKAKSNALSPRMVALLGDLETAKRDIRRISKNTGFFFLGTPKFMKALKRSGFIEERD